MTHCYRNKSWRRAEGPFLGQHLLKNSKQKSNTSPTGATVT